MQCVDPRRSRALCPAPALGLALLCALSVGCEGVISLAAELTAAGEDAGRNPGRNEIQGDASSAWVEENEDPGSSTDDPAGPGPGGTSKDGGAAAIACNLTASASTLPPTTPGSSGHPSILLNATEIAAIRARVSAGAEPWATAYRNLITAANAAKSLAPRSVRTEGNPGADYYTENAYCGWGADSPCGADCCDGRNNPNADRADYSAAIAVGHAVRDLGLGYAFTGDASYADHAIVLLRHWALNSATAMTPKFTNIPSEIELAITIPAMFYGADLIWSYPKWTDRAAFARWAAAFGADVRGKSAGTAVQNFGDWRLVLLGMAAVVSDDPALLKYTFDHYKALVPNQINAKGELFRETDRTKALSYSLYALNAISQVAEIARHHGVDLYHFTGANGTGSLERAFDWLAPYVLNPATWPYQQISPITVSDNIASFELGYLAWGKANYLSAMQKFGRPLVDIRTAGPLTLTHGRGAFDWQLATPSTAAPAGQAVIAADKRSGVAPLTIKFNAAQSMLAGAAAETFSWDFGDGASSETSAPAHTFTDPGCYSVTLTVSRGSEERSTALRIRADAANATSFEGSELWAAAPVASQTGRFSATFELTPAADNMNGVTGFSKGNAGAYEQLAAVVRLSPEGRIDARDGDAYAAVTSVPYAAGKTYQVRMEVDVAGRTYSVFVTPPGGAELEVARDYTFRSEQSAIDRLDHVAVYAQDGSHLTDALAIETL